MDFSENYAYKYTEEVQSLHFGGSRGQVCLHTAVVYLRRGDACDRNPIPFAQLVTWNYQEAGHGKGAPGGIGAVIKRTADYRVKFEEHEIKMKDLMLPKDIATFKGTLEVHQVVWSSDSTYLEFRKQSCFECLNFACVHDKHLPSTSQTTTTTSLRSIRRSWANQSFVGDYTKASSHEEEFLKFIKMPKDENDSMSD
ncbi:hypothetical protein ACJJTC_012445 [Scirpophaga incertulas]